MKSVNFEDRLLSRAEAAEYLGVKYNTLSVWASTKRYNLPYVKIGRLIKYRESDLLIFIEQNRDGGFYASK